ncbi:MAG: general secretion pathway protein GspE [Planctomycetaceae bacterium]|nr:general secretion pathway protein GspE [Planctomycetaceae bacterium]
MDVYKAWLGIPEGQRPPDYYTLLRVVQFEDSAEKIQNNYRKLNAHVRKYATGQYMKESQELLNELAKAMLCLTDPVSKREYDESLGREFGEESGDEPRTVLDYLVAQEAIRKSQVAEIERFAEARGISSRDAVVQMKLVPADQATRGLAVELRMAYIDLDDMLPEDNVLDLLPRQVVKRHTCLPLFEDRGRLLVACVDEPGHDLEDEIRLRYDMPMRAVLAVPRSIQQAIAKYYAPGARDEATAAAPQAKSKKGGSSTAKAAASKPDRPKAGPLSDEEKTNRRNVSLIIVCWSLIGTVMGIHLSGAMGTVGMFATGAVVAGVVFGILKMTYWK